MNEIRLSEKEWPVERRWKATGKSRCFYLAELEKAVYGKFGEEGMELIRELWRKGAERFFLSGVAGFGIQGRGPADLLSYFKLGQEIMGYEMEFVEATEKKAVLRYHTCHFFEKPDPVAVKLCEAHFEFEKRAIEMFNPKLKIKFAALKSAGDPYCELVAELK